MTDEIVTIHVPRALLKRMLGLVRERRRRAERGLAKFATDFDHEKGRNLVAARDDCLQLEERLDV
jgi:hypothetical protein